MSRRALVAVIGDAGVREGSPQFDAARALGRLLVDAGFRVVTGGLGGVMEAACRGAHESTSYREGDTVGIVPHADPAEANPWADIVIATSLDHGRNTLVANADAVIAVGGGAGTLSEIAFAWMYKRLVVGMTVSGWSGELAGRRLDARQRCPDVPDDRIFAAADPHTAVQLVVDRLPEYGARHRGFRQGTADSDKEE